MRVYTAHLSAKDAPALVREGFSFWAMVLGWLWLAAHRAWIAAIIDLALMVAIVATTTGAPSGGLRGVLLAALAVLQGMFGNDLRRWGLSRRGFVLTNVVAARDRDGAFSRLMAARPELLEQAARGLP